MSATPPIEGREAMHRDDPDIGLESLDRATPRQRRPDIPSTEQSRRASAPAPERSRQLLALALGETADSLGG